MNRIQNGLTETIHLWRLFTWRHWRMAPVATLVLISILSLGVGVFFSIRLANRAAVSGFSLFTETLNGESDLIITSPAGRIPVGALQEIRELLDELPASLFPVIETTATAATTNREADGFNAEQFRLVGVDLLALPNLIFLNPPSYRPPVDFGADNPSQSHSTRWSLDSADDDQIFITAQKAETDQIKIGDPLPLVINDQRVQLRVAGIIPENDFSARKPAELLVMDLPSLQRLVGEPDTVDRIELRLPSGPLYQQWLQDTRSRLAAASATHWRVNEPERQRQTGAIMTQAFRLNLTILSGLALMVGIYLILQAMEAAVMKRRMEIATLKSLGLSQRSILRAWILESFSLGFAGSLFGLAIGYLGAQFAVGAIARTVNSLYYSNTTSAASWHWGEASLAFGIGLLASGIAGWLPARDAASTPPAQVLARGNRSPGIVFLSRPRWGALALVIGFLCYHLPPLTLGPGIHFPLAGYSAALAWVIGTSILCGVLFRPLANSLRSLWRHSAVGTYAASQLQRPSGRHRLTAAGLLVAIGMAGGMSLLIASFENTMVVWIRQALKADLYVAVQGVGNISSDNRLRPETWKQFAADPDVAEAEIGQMYPIEFRGAQTYLVGASFGLNAGWRHMVWLSTPEKPFHELDHQGEIVPTAINESFQQRFDVTVGERIEIPVPGGVQRLVIVGVFVDYGNERGSLVVSRQRLADWYSEESAINFAAHLVPSADPDEVRRRWMEQHPGLVVRTNRHLREEVMTVFHETFSVTHALKWIGVAVALVGLGLGLWSILLERRDELRVLKELGMSRHHIAKCVSLEGVGLTIAGVVGGICLSIALGRLLIFVVNYQSFGWTLSFRIPWIDLGQLTAGVLFVAAGVAYCVGYHSARLPSDREE